MSLSENPANPYLNMGGFPNLPFSSSFPISQAFPSLPVRQAWPDAATGAMAESKKQRKHPGSAGEVEINYQAQLRLLEDGSHNNILDGDLLFSISLEIIPASLYTMTLLNITDINFYLRSKYKEGKLQFRELEGSRDKRFSHQLRCTPTQRWIHLPEIAQGLDNPKQRTMALSLAYLTSHCIDSYFNFYGFARGELPDTKIKAIAVARGNVISDVKNYWGNDALPGMNLWLVRTRLFKAVKGRYSRFAFVPVACYDKPSYSDRAYIDMTGNVQHATCTYVGKLIRWLENVNYTSDMLDILLGNNKPETRATIRSEGSIRVKMCSIPGLKTNFVP